MRVHQHLQLSGTDPRLLRARASGCSSFRHIQMIIALELNRSWAAIHFRRLTPTAAASVETVGNGLCAVRPIDCIADDPGGMLVTSAARA